MVEPVSMSVVTCAILRVVPLIWNAALTARQNKKECSALATRAWNLGLVLPNFAGAAAANDPATAYGLARLSEALGKALRLIESCQAGGILGLINIGQTATDLENVRSTINDCLVDLNFFSIARAHAMSTHAAAQAYDVHSSYHHHQAQGGAPGYFQPPGNAQWVPSPAPYNAAQPAPSGSRLSSLFTLPTVKRMVNHVRR